MESQHRLLLRAWIEAIIHHAIVRLAVEAQRPFILSQLQLLERDFGVTISMDDDYIVEINYMEKPVRM